MLPKPCVIDVVDVSEKIGTYWCDCLQGHNTTTIPLGGISNAIEKVVDKVLEVTRGEQVLRCLAFWGHGLVDNAHNPLGVHLIAGGADAQWPARSAFTNATIMAVHQSLIRLNGSFVDTGRAELRGCGAAGTPEGIEVMKMLAYRWGIPVQAATKNQPLLNWTPPVLEVSPSGTVTAAKAIEYTLRD